PTNAALSTTTVKCDSPLPSSPAWPRWRALSLMTSIRVGSNASVSKVSISCARVPLIGILRGFSSGPPITILMRMRAQKFHGRYESDGRDCDAPGCAEAGEFRAPGSRSSGFDGPGEWRWMCLEHVREFNAGYDWFEGMSAEEIFGAQSPTAGWRTESPAFRTSGVPRW